MSCGVLGVKLFGLVWSVVVCVSLKQHFNTLQVNYLLSIKGFGSVENHIANDD